VESFFSKPSLDRIWFKELTCPNCQRRFKTPRPKRNSYTVGSRDPDFYIHYTGENPYYYAVAVCPHCYFAFDLESFAELSIVDRRGLSAVLSGLTDLTRFDFGSVRDLPTALAAHELAIAAMDYVDNQNMAKGRILLRASWLYRDQEEMTGEPTAERRLSLIRQAAEYFELAYTTDRLENQRLGAGAVAYLVGELRRQLGEYDQAVRWFGRAISASDLPPEIERMARDQWNVAREQKRRDQQPGARRGQVLVEERRMERAVYNLYRDQVRWIERMARSQGISTSEYLRKLIDRVRAQMEGGG